MSAPSHEHADAVPLQMLESVRAASLKAAPAACLSAFYTEVRRILDETQVTCAWRKRELPGGGHCSA